MFEKTLTDIKILKSIMFWSSLASRVFLIGWACLQFLKLLGVINHLIILRNGTYANGTKQVLKRRGKGTRMLVVKLALEGTYGSS